MARSNYFKPSWHGYRNVMNSNNEVMTACQTRGETLAASASRQSGTEYVVDSRLGMTRVHTRVSTASAKDYFRERHYRALSIAIGMAGGAARFGGYGNAKAKRKFTATRGGRGRKGWS